MTKKKCIAKTKAGNPCKANAVKGGDYCSSHQPKAEVPLVIEKQPVANAIGLCGHINRHAKDVDGNYLVCTKVKDHTGDHKTEMVTYKWSQPVEDPMLPGIFERKITGTGKRMTHWKDIAGTPADEIEPDLASLKGGQPFQEKDIGLK